MSFLKKLLGRDFEGSVQRAEDLAAAGRLGEAVLGLRAALQHTKDVDSGRVQTVRARLATLQDDLAATHVEAGKRLASEGDVAGARERFETACEVAASERVRDEVRTLIDRLDADEARSDFEDAGELSEDERYAALTGSWEEDEADELEGYGADFKKAFLLLHDGDPAASADQMAAIAEQHAGAVFLLYHLGMAEQQAGRLDASIATLERFLRAVRELYDDDEVVEDDDGETVDPRLMPFLVRAHARLAESYMEKKASEAAEQQLRELVSLLPEESTPYVALGRFLREVGRAKEALEVLQQARPLMGELRPDMGVPRELGLTHAALGNVKDAIECLTVCIEHQSSFGDFNFRPEDAVPLAELCIQSKELERAADLYRHLAAGTHAAGHFIYNLKAGGLLLDLGKADLSRRYLTRARELAGDDATRAEVDALLARLESPS
jgi:tetratricopeptide (TPR) repeat protein